MKRSFIFYTVQWTVSTNLTNNNNKNRTFYCQVFFFSFFSPFYKTTLLLTGQDQVEEANFAIDL